MLAPVPIRGLTAVVGVLLLAGSPALASPTSPFNGDRRLEGTVTIDRRRVYLGELLDEVGSQVGVRLSASDMPGAASGYELTAIARKRRAVDLLHALSALYSAPPDRWYWTRTGKGSQSSYVLKHTLTARNVRDQRSAEALGRLRQQYALLSKFYAADGALRNQLMERHPFLAKRHDPLSEGGHSVLQSLTPAQREGLLLGGELRVLVSSLSLEARSFVQEYWRRSGAEGGAPPSLTLRYFEKIGPSIGFQTGAAGGGALLGGVALENEMAEWEQGRWRSDLAGVPNRHIDGGGAPTPGRANPDAALDAFSSRAAVDLLFDHARSAGSTTHNFRNVLTGKLADVLRGFEAAGLISRWRHGFALFRERRWSLADRLSAVPWPLRKGLRASAAAAGGYLGLADWLKLSRLHPQQLDDLGDEFPDTGLIKQLQIPLRVVAGMEARERANLSRPRGCGWDDWSLNTRKRVSALFTPAEARRTRIFLSISRDAQPPEVAFYFGEDDPNIRPRRLQLRPWRKQKRE